MSGKGIGGDTRERRRGPVQLAELVGKALGPLAARRGFATADLIAAWPAIVGARFAASTRPDRIVWPRGTANESKPAVLVVRVDGPAAVLFQHEAGQIVERTNAFLGYAAVGQIRIVQGPIGAPEGDEPEPTLPISAEDETRLEDALAPLDDEGLRAALGRLGRAVLADKSR